MSITIEEKVSAEFKRLRDQVLAANGFTKFGESEQMEIIGGLIEFALNDEECQREGAGSITPFIGSIANASAAAQRWEKNGFTLANGEKKKLVRATRGSGGSKSKFD